MASSSDHGRQETTAEDSSTHSSSCTGPAGHVRKASRSFTARAAALGVVLGVLVCVTNVYFGLQTGGYSGMSPTAALLGYMILQPLTAKSNLPFSPQENVLVQTIAGALGCMPATAGLTSVIFGLEHLIKPEEGGILKIIYTKLVVWSLSLTFSGLIFAFILRGQYVVRTAMPWPGARVVASLIQLMHRKKIPPHPIHTVGPTPLLDESLTTTRNYSSTFSHDSEGQRGSETARMSDMRTLVTASICSGAVAFLSYFFPVLRRLPVFGRAAQQDWLWFWDASPGFLGLGMIAGPTISLHMLCGAIVGWGILSPLAKQHEWAPGRVNDWETGSRGWLLWVSMAILLADGLVNLLWPVVRILCVGMAGVFKGYRTATYSPLAANEPTSNTESYPTESQPSRSGDSTLVRPSFLWPALFISSTFCVLAVKMAFEFVPVYAMITAVLLSLPLSVLGIRGLAETAYNPMSAIGKMTQLIFATIVPKTNPHATAISLLANGVAEAAAGQAGDLCFDLKVGHLVGADEVVQLYGQLIGCVLGAFISTAVYKLFLSAYEIPGELFQVPSAFMAILTARLVYGDGLPLQAGNFALGFGLLFALIAVIKIYGADNKWNHLLPSGTTFAIGIYNTPSFSLSRAVGGLLYWHYSRSHSDGKNFMMVLAGGLVFGEGVMSLVHLALSSAHVPRWSA